MRGGDSMEEYKTKMPPKGVGAPDDFYTPDNALYPLLPYINKDYRIWESASGTGNIINFFRKNGFDIFGTDIKEGQDFLTSNRNDFDCIVTNPPFSIKDKWLEKCYLYGKPFALLLPLTALEGKFRHTLYKKYGIEVMIFDGRVQYMGGKSCWFNSAWFCWGLDLPDKLNFMKLENKNEQELLF